MKQSSLLWVGIVVLAWRGFTFGQTLTLQNVLRTAIQVNPKLHGIENLVKAKQGAAQQANIALNPSLGVSAGNRVQFFKIGQEIEYPGKRAARTQAALAEIEVAKTGMDWAVLELQQEVAKLFYDVLWAQKNVELLQDNLKITEKFSEAAAYKFNQGFGSKLDVIKGQVEAARAKRLLKAAEQARMVSQSRLKILLKMKSPGPLFSSRVSISFPQAAKKNDEERM
jgi:outer membrane protein TolC